MTSNTDLPTPLKYITVVAAVIGAVLLVAPFAPPQAGFFGFIAILLLGASGYFAVAVTAKVLYDTADDVLPEIPDEYDDYPVDNDIVREYVDGEMTEEEFEAEVERALENETDL